jgi:hypothetical protein
VFSQQVSWWTVHEFVVPWLQGARPFPMLGTPSWVALDNRDPVKWAALLDAAQHWALRVETCQQTECEASHDISAAYNWGAIGRGNRRYAEFYKQKPYLKRRAS